MLLQLKTQHPQTSIHGILFLRQLHLPSHPRLHPHFMRCNTASGAGGFKQQLERSDLNLHQMSNQMQLVLGGTGEFHKLFSKSWICNVPDECVSPVSQKLVGGFLLRLHDLSRGTNGAHSLLYTFWINTEYRQSVPTESIHQRADQCHSRALLVHPGSHHHKT